MTILIINLTKIFQKNTSRRNQSSTPRNLILFLTFIIIALIIIVAIVFYFIGKNANKLKNESENINNIFIENPI